jgi:predicted HTH domain antitoxin
MPITIELPEDIEHQLETALGNLSRRALEALAVEGYRSGDLSVGQVAEMLKLSVWETEKSLKERKAYLHYSSEDCRQDIETQERILSR